MIRTPIKCVAPLFALTFLGGCTGDPTARFKTFVENAASRARADDELAKKLDLEAIEFDVTKTDSTISPYTAQVTISAVYRPAAAKEAPSGTNEVSRFVQQFHDYGDRKYVFVYAFQENKWVLKQSKAEGSGAAGFLAAITGPPQECDDYLETIKGPPKSLAKYFTP